MLERKLTFAFYVDVVLPYYAIPLLLPGPQFPPPGPSEKASN